MSDEELDRDWKPNGRRPQSTMALSFSAALDDLFKIDNSLADLDAAVEQKKRAISSQTSELQDLEARLKAAEERLKQRMSMSTAMNMNRADPRQRVPAAAPTAPPTRPEAMEENTPRPRAASRSEPKHESKRESRQEPRPESRHKTSSRPSNTRRRVASHTASRPGALPPTPGASEGEHNATDAMRVSSRSSADYVVVDKDGDSDS